MAEKIIVANFKAEPDHALIKTWWKDFISQSQDINLENKKIIICPPVVYLEYCQKQINKSGLQISLGAQDLSRFERGAFTGETTITMLKDLVEYVIIGHSERRNYLNENHEWLQRKITIANKYGLSAILCSDRLEAYEGQIWALAYEPLAAIGTENAESATNSWQNLQKIKEGFTVQHYLYGGSVKAENAVDFIRVGFDGVLVGKKSLNPTEFINVISNL